jgi:hypothetical protein
MEKAENQPDKRHFFTYTPVLICILQERVENLPVS